MSNPNINKIVTAIDIGTTKICTLIAITDGEKDVEIIGIGEHPSLGLKKGVVVNITQTVESIKKALNDAQKMAGVSTQTATVGISGSHIQSYNSTGIVAIRGQDVSQYDINRVIDAAKAIPIAEGQDILHVLPQYFRVDGQEYVLDSLGMYGVRLEAQVHIITGAVASAQNIIKSCELAGIYMPDIVLEQLASAQAVLTESEQELGAGIIDIGGGTSDFALYKDGRIRHSKVLPIAGNHFTNDLAIGLGLPLKEAETLKKQLTTLSKELQKTIKILLDYEGGEKTVDLSFVTEILEARAEEIFELFCSEFDAYKLKKLMPSGIVITGGGSLLNNIKTIAREKLDLPVRLGMPRTQQKHEIPDRLKNPIYATAYGLLLYAVREKKHDYSASIPSEHTFTHIYKRMKSWIYDFL